MQLVLDFVTVYNNYEFTRGKNIYHEINGDRQDIANVDNDYDYKLNHSHFGVNFGIKFSL